MEGRERERKGDGERQRVHTSSPKEINMPRKARVHLRRRAEEPWAQIHN